GVAQGLIVFDHEYSHTVILFDRCGICLCFCGGRTSHETDAFETRTPSNAHHLGKHLVARVEIGANTELRLRISASLDGHQPLQLVHAHGLFVPEELPCGVDCGVYDLGVLLHWLGRGLRDVDLDGMAEQRSRDDENHQQHKHHVDERHHVDLGNRLPAALVIETAEG